MFYYDIEEMYVQLFIYTIYVSICMNKCHIKFKNI